MNCEACHEEKITGDTYIVRYGFERRELISYKRMAVYQSIVGTRNVWICDHCLNRYITRHALIAGIGLPLMMAAVGLSNYSSSKQLAALISPIILGIIVGLVLYLIMSRQGKRTKGLQNLGDVYAIRLVKPELKRQGYRSFYTRQD
jgi:hypothetical protein